MAIALTGRGSTTSYDPGSITITSASFTPSDNSRLAVIAGVGNQSGDFSSGWSISNSGVALTWDATPRFLVLDSGFGGESYAVVVYTAPVTSHAAMTVTLSHSAAASTPRLNLHIFDVTGVDSVTPISSNTTNGTGLGGGSYALTLPSSPLSTSLVVGARLFEDGGLAAVAATPGSSFTELHDTNADPAGWAGLQTEYRLSSTSTTVDWVDVSDNSNSEFASIALAIEFPVFTALRASYIGHPKPKIRYRAQGLI